MDVRLPIRLKLAKPRLNKKCANSTKRVNGKVTGLDRACLIGEMIELLLHRNMAIER